MIVRPLAGGRLLCINQTTHALMAAAICRHWGNAAFAPPDPFEPVLTAISQHDNGWTEWEQAPCLRDDGYPMDFVHGPDAEEKLQLWQRGIDRIAAQDPYAGLLIGEHATRLYTGMLARMDRHEEALTRRFIDAQRLRHATVSRLFGEALATALTDAAFAANTTLLQIGDTTSLQLCMPWAAHRTFIAYLRSGEPVSLAMKVMVPDARTDLGTAGQVTFDPWPFDREQFVIRVHGRVLTQSLFADEPHYHAALADAPIGTLAWHFARTA